MSLRAFRYKLPLVSPIRLKGEWVSHREGVLLNRDDHWAEAAPLPGFSRESLDDVISELHTGDAESPSLRFAFSMLDMADRLTGTAIDDVCVHVNALVQGTDEEIQLQCLRLAESNCSAVKLKVRDPIRDVSLVHRLRDHMGSGVKIRLDANRAWNYDQAISFLANVRSSNVEYIEEPLESPDRLESLFAHTQVPYALDETLSETVTRISDFPNAAALVVKPTLIGGLEQIEHLAASNKTLVFSAAYESGVGIAQIARLAARYSSDVAAGLDTYSRLAGDVLAQRLTMVDWKLTVPGRLGIRPESLHKIDL